MEILKRVKKSSKETMAKSEKESNRKAMSAAIETNRNNIVLVETHSDNTLSFRIENVSADILPGLIQLVKVVFNQRYNAEVVANENVLTVKCPDAETASRVRESWK